MKLLLASLLAATLAVPVGHAAERPPVIGVSHIALFVHDVAKSRAFYKELLGFDEPFSLTNKDGSLHVTWIKINDRQSVELFPEKEAGSDRLNHYSIETSDAEAMRAYLASRGVKVPDKVGKGRIGNLNFNIADPDGHTVEIVQYAPDSWTLREQGKFMPDTRISTHLTHVGILVGALEPALRFYRDVLGGRETWRGARGSKQLSWVNCEIAGFGRLRRVHALRRAAGAGQAGQAAPPLPNGAGHREGQSHSGASGRARRLQPPPGNRHRHQP